MGRKIGWKIGEENSLCSPGTLSLLSPRSGTKFARCAH